MRVVGVGGEPAVGKSTLAAAVLKSLGWPGGWARGKAGLLRWTQSERCRVAALGVYGGGERFPGTDRLSMAVQPEALGVLGSWAGSDAMKDWSVFFEGDRLFNASFLTALEGDERFDCRWVILAAGEKTLARRHRDRGDTQNEKWLRGRRTKLANIQSAVQSFRPVMHDTVQDREAAVRLIRKLLGVLESR